MYLRFILLALLSLSVSLVRGGENGKVRVVIKNVRLYFHYDEFSDKRCLRLHYRTSVDTSPPVFPITEREASEVVASYLRQYLREDPQVPPAARSIAERTLVRYVYNHKHGSIEKPHNVDGLLDVKIEDWQTAKFFMEAIQIYFEGAVNGFKIESSGTREDFFDYFPEGVDDRTPNLDRPGLEKCEV